MKLNKLFPLCCFIPALLSAQEFQASGIGDTPEQAKHDAVTNAIKQSVGELIVSKEELNNEDFTQKIVGYSNAYANKISVNASKKLENGTYQAEVTVDIESQKLLGQLKEMQVAVLSNVIDNSTLLKADNQLAKRNVNQKTQKNFEEMVEELLIAPLKESKPLASIEINGKLKEIKPEEFEKINEAKYMPRYTSRDKELYLPFELNFSIVQNEEYINNLTKILNEIKPKSSSSKPVEIKAYDLKKIANENQRYKTYAVDSEKYKTIYDIYNGLGIKYNNSGCVFIELLDKEGYEIAKVKSETRNSGCRNASSFAINNPNVFSPIILSKKENYKYLHDLMSEHIILPDLGWHDGKFTTGKLDLKLYLLLNREEMENFKDIKIYFSE